MLPGQQVEKDAEWTRGKVGSFLRLLLNVLGHRPFPHLVRGIWIPITIPTALQLSPGRGTGDYCITAIGSPFLIDVICCFIHKGLSNSFSIYIY